MWQKISLRWLTISLVCAAVFLDLATFKDYGIPLDDPYHFAYGQKAIASYQQLKNLSSGITPMHEMHHGPVFQVFLTLAGQLLHPSNPGQALQQRYIILFLFFLSGVAGLYLLSRIILPSPSLALLAPVFLFLTPRLYGHAHFNVADIPCMVLFIFAITSLIYYLKHPSTKNLIIHAIFSAILIDTRVFGLFVPFLTFLFILVTPSDQHPPPTKYRIAARNILIYTAIVIALGFIGWPFLWDNPLASLLTALNKTTISRWQQPWHYLPANIILSTPLMITCFSLYGLVMSSLWLIQRKLPTPVDRRYLTILLLWLLVPSVLPIILHASFYNGWRHHFFIYPPLLLFALLGIYASLGQLKLIIARMTGREKLATRVSVGVLGGIIAISLFWSAHSMIKLYPYEHLYYNPLLMNLKTAQAKNYALDYWGLSYKEGLEYVAAHSANQVIIAVDDQPGLVNLQLLPVVDQQRLTAINIQKLTISLALPFRPCLKPFLKQHRWKYHYDHKTEQLISRGLIWEPDFDQVRTCFSDSHLTQRISQHVMQDQYEQFEQKKQQLLARADYYLTTFRPQREPAIKAVPIHTITRNGAIILAIYKLR